MRVSTLTATQKRLELLAGKVAVELSPQPVGSSFGIVTGAGTAVAIGTAFTVEVRAGTAVTRVMHGAVRVRSSAGFERRVAAHQEAAMNGEPTELPSAAEESELRLLRAPHHPSSVPARVEPSAAASGMARPRGKHDDLVGAAVEPRPDAADPATQREMLYASAAGQLVELDPQTRMQRTVGALNDGLLVGTHQGQLRVLRDEGEAGIVLTELSLTDASPTRAWTIAWTADDALLSASPWAGDVAVLLASGLYRLRTATSELAHVASFPSDRQIAAIATSVCAKGPR